MESTLLFKFVFVILFFAETTNGHNSAVNGTFRSDRPSFARLLSGPPLGCTYQGQNFSHGDQVVTSEPCLNCTCKRGVLLCFLRVCPSLIHFHVDESCETIREPGQCCPVVRCPNQPSTLSSWTTDPTSWPEEREDGPSSNESPTTVYSPPQEVANSLTSEINAEFDAALRKKLVGKGNNNRVVVTHRDEATVFQTNPTTVFYDSPKLVTSSPGHYSQHSKDDIDNFPAILNKINRDCYINSTLYAEGSALMSSSYCEYCYCIRGKKMCLRPRCHLAILGCMPRYTSEYACCPSSYVCGNSPYPSVSLDERTLPPSSMATSTTTTTTTSTTPRTTTSTTTTTTTTARPVSASTSDYAFSRKVCRLNGIIYQLGDHVPSDVPCQNCYCSYGGAKRCKKIHCSPVMEGCIPVIPEGHCCPVEYKCYGGNKARKDITLEKESTIPGEEVTTGDYWYNVTALPQVTTMSDLEIPTEPVDSELVETTSQVNVELRSAELKGDSFRREPVEEVLATMASVTDPSLLLNSNDVTTYSSLTNKGSHFNSYYNNELRDLEPTELSDDIDSTTMSPGRLSVTPTTTILTTETVTEKKPNSSWFRLDGKGEPDGVELFLGGIIEALERRIQSSLPAEPRTPLDTKQLETNKHRESSDHDDDDGSSLSHYNPITSSDGLIVKLNETSSNVTEKTTNEKPVVGTIFVKPEPDEHLKYHSSSLDSDTVEIITAATSFLDDLSQPDSGSIVHSNETVKGNNKAESKSDSDSSSGSSAGNSKIPINYSLGSDEWKVINHNHRPHKGATEDHDPFGYKFRSEDSDNFETQANLTDTMDKKSRSETDEESSFSSALNPAPGYQPNVKYIPFGSGDVSANFPPISRHKPNSSFSIRLPQNRKPPMNSQKQVPIMTSCRVGDQEYSNGAMISKPDPCVLCRCFYGRELCHQQKCPSPPRAGCTPNFVEGYCCPRYICKLSEDSSSINPAITMNPGLKPFQKGQPVQPPKLGYIPLPGLPSGAESGIRETQIPNLGPRPLHENEKQSPSSTNVHGNIPINNVNSNINKNRIHFPTSVKPVNQENKNNSGEPQGIHPSSLLTHLLKGAGSPSSLSHGQRIPSNRPTWPLPGSHSIGTQVKPGLQHKPDHKATVRPDFIMPTSPDLLRLSRPTTEKPIIASMATTIKPGAQTSKPVTVRTPSFATDDTFDFDLSKDPLADKILNKAPDEPTALSSESSSEPSSSSSSPSSSSSGSGSPWDALRVSGCNIYGTFYKVDQVVDELSSSCKKCFCSSFGVQCNKVC